MKALQSHEIPQDLLIEILTRLPAKSLMRFKSVSKQWSSLICSKDFTNLFSKVSSSPPRLCMCLRFSENSHLKGLSLSSPFTYQDLPILKDYCVSHVFRGLMCFVDKQNRAHVYNTTTRQNVVLPDIQESDIIHHSNKSIMYTIGHDPVHDLYKVICTMARSFYFGEMKEEIVFQSEHWVLVLGDKSCRWRNIASRCPPHLPIGQGLTINGRMHYFALDEFAPLFDISHVLVSIDINSEEIRMLARKVYPTYADLIDYHGKVAFLHHVDLKHEGKFKLWVMEDAEGDRWSKRTLTLHPSQMHLVNSIDLKIEGTTRNGEVILVPESKTRFHTLLYDLEKNHMRKLQIKGAPNRHLTEIFDVVVGFDDIENIMYITT